MSDSDEARAHQEAVTQALTLVELRETALLSWGAVDASFTQSEITELISADLPGGMSPAGVLAEMLQALLIVKTPEGGFRSRMAETIACWPPCGRCSRTGPGGMARPWSWTSGSCTGPAPGPGVVPPSGEFLAQLEKAVTPAARRVAERLVPAKLSGFQERATMHILDALRAGADRGVIVTAGAGSGKSWLSTCRRSARQASPSPLIPPTRCAAWRSTRATNCSRTSSQRCCARSVTCSRLMRPSGRWWSGPGRAHAPLRESGHQGRTEGLDRGQGGRPGGRLEMPLPGLPVLRRGAVLAPGGRQPGAGSGWSAGHRAAA